MNENILVTQEQLDNAKWSDNIPIKCQFCGKQLLRTKRNIMQSLRTNGLISCNSRCKKSQEVTKIYNCKTCGKIVKRNINFVGKNVFCSSSCNAKYSSKTVKRTWITEEWKKNISDKMKIKTKLNPKGFHINPNREKQKQTWRQKYPRKLFICKECKKEFEAPASSNRKYCSHECSFKNNYHPNSTKVHKAIYKNQKLDSGAELIFVKLLDQKNISWMKNTTQFFTFIDETGKVRKYYPDFFLSEYNLWIEIKGKRYKRPDDNLRLKSVGNIKRIYSTELKDPSIIEKTLAPYRSVDLLTTARRAVMLPLH